MCISPLTPSSYILTAILDLLIAWSCLFAFDMAIFFLTLIKALTLRYDGARPLMEVILRDGKLPP